LNRKTSCDALRIESEDLGRVEIKFKERIYGVIELS